MAGIIKPAPGNPDANSPALSATKTQGGQNYIFYFDQDKKIYYLKGPDDGPYGEYGVTVKKDGVSVAVTGGINTLTSTLYGGEEVHVYYVDTDHSLKAAWWHVSEGQWNTGLINAKGYKASSGSGISSLGYQELHGQPGDYKLKVYFKDRDNDDKLTVAYYKDHQWDKKVVE